MIWAKWLVCALGGGFVGGFIGAVVGACSVMLWQSQLQGLLLPADGSWLGGPFGTVVGVVVGVAIQINRKDDPNSSRLT